MKEELEKLGFEYNKTWQNYKLEINRNYLVVTLLNDVCLQDTKDLESVYLFDYNHEKLKQLIKLLS